MQEFCPKGRNIVTASRIFYGQHSINLQELNAAEKLILSYYQQPACLKITVNVLRARSGMLCEEIPRNKSPTIIRGGTLTLAMIGHKILVSSLRMKAVNKAKMIRAYLKITSTLTVNPSWGRTQMIKLAVHTAKDDDN